MHVVSIAELVGGTSLAGAVSVTAAGIGLEALLELLGGWRVGG